MHNNIFTEGTAPSTSAEASGLQGLTTVNKGAVPQGAAPFVVSSSVEDAKAAFMGHVKPCPAPCRQAERGAEDGAELPGSLSLCHNSNAEPDLPFRLTGSQRKTAFALEQNVSRLVSEAGLDNCGFLTLTVGDDSAEGFRQVWDADEASRRINSLITGLLRDLFGRCVVVTERHKSGAIHFHLIVDCKGDIRSGFDFSAFFDKRAYAHTATEHLKSLWAILRDRLPGYGFGRSELTPIYKSGEAVACYVAKYVEKNLFARVKEDRGKKLVRYVGWKRSQMTANGFCWATEGAIEWRKNVRAIASAHGITTKEDMAAAWGPRWAHRLTQVIVAVERSPELHTQVLADRVRDWSERAMICPTWWRDAEDIAREQEFGSSHGELREDYVTPEDIAEMFAQLREAA